MNDKETVAHIHNGILLSHKKEHISVRSNEVRMAINKSLQTINAGEGVEEREHSCTVGGNVN